MRGRKGPATGGQGGTEEWAEAIDTDREWAWRGCQWVGGDPEGWDLWAKGFPDCEKEQRLRFVTLAFLHL